MDMKHVGLLVLLVIGSGGLVRADSGVPVTISVLPSNGTASVNLEWGADKPVYNVLTTTNLNGEWSPATNCPLTMTNLIGQYCLPVNDGTRFFRVETLDTEGPLVVDQYPDANSAGVGRFSPLVVVLQDESGIDTNDFWLVINGGATLTNGSPGLTFSANGFRYDPGAVPWGDFDGTATVSFTCADLRSNHTTVAWSFSLEVQTIIATNLLHFGVVSEAKNGLSTMASPDPAMHTVAGLSIISFETNRIVFSYTGESSGLYVGAIMVSHDPSLIFYRRITGIINDPGNHMVAADTVDVPLTDLIQEGSFTPVAFQATGSAQFRPLWTVPFNARIPFSYNHEFTALQFEWESVRIRPDTISYDLTGGISVECKIKDWHVAVFNAEITNAFHCAFRAGVEIYTNVTLLEKTQQLGSAVPVGTVWGEIAGIPVKIDLLLSVDLVLALNSEGAVSFETGFDASSSSRFRLEWTPEGWSHSSQNQHEIVPVPLDINFKVSASADLFIKPQLSAMVYSLGGLSADYRRGPGLKAKYEQGDSQCEITLYDKWSVNGALTIIGVEDSKLPKITFFEDKRILKTWYWPTISDVAPVFSIQPSNVMASAGSAIQLTSSASGNPEPTYQWYQNGVAIPGKIGNTLSLTLSSQSAGNYYVLAVNRFGEIRSTTATVVLSLPATRGGMVLIPAGSNNGTNPLGIGDLGNPESYDPVWYPQTYSLTVSSYYMDKNLVTKAQWDEVYNWAVTHGYSFDNAGSGKAANHPVQTVNWYDCVKWCNARSEKEGRSPAYYTTSSKNMVYKTGQINIEDNCVNWSSGYRLPQPVEWEYAARGGVSGKRFPWGDTIDHDKANYFGYPPGYSYGYQIGYSYDFGYEGYDTRYSSTGYPYTSPVGSFEAGKNGYGLYDMVGNVSQWCWSWLPPWQSGTEDWGRVIRGGNWSSVATYSRIGGRSGLIPVNELDYVGFRSVLPTGQ